MMLDILIEDKWYPASERNIKKGDWYRTNKAKPEKAKEDGKINKRKEES